MPHILKTFAHLMLLLVCFAPVLAAQESGPARGQAEPANGRAEGAAGGEFTSLHRQWQEADARLDQLAAQYRQAPDVDARRRLLAEYQQGIAQNEQLFRQLRGVALAEYRQAPNTNPAVTHVLLGILDDSLRRDRYDEAADVAMSLLEHRAPEKALPDLAGRVAYCRDDFTAAKQLLQQAQQTGAISEEGQGMLRDVEQAIPRWQRESQLRQREAADDDLPRVSLETNKGRIVLELLENEAPQAVHNFISLVEKKFYDGVTFHRVLPGFMAQGGCPQGTGTGGPGYKIYCESHQDDHRHHFRGSLSMAHAGRDTGGSQFFLTFRRTPHLDGQHTVFGRVIEGHEVLADLQRRNPQQARGLPAADQIIKAEVLRKRPHAYEPKKVVR